MAGPAKIVQLCFLAVFLLISSPCVQVHGLMEFLGQCGLTIDLMLSANTQSGLLNMPLPETMDKYQDPNRPINCDVIITFTSGTHLLIELYFVDIMPRSGDIRACSTGLEIFDQSGRKYYGGRICSEGWLWEERHREKQQEKHLVQYSPLTFRLVSQGPYRGQGFRLHFNQLRPNWPCYTREYKCQQIQRCVHYDLTCDGWDDCGDYSDERQEAGCMLLTAAEICAIIMGVLLLIGAVAEIVMFIVHYNRLSQEYGLKSDLKVPAVNEKYNMEPVFAIGRRQNSQDSLPSRTSRSTAAMRGRQESDSDSVDKLDLEKAGRQQVKHRDDTSERSGHSTSRRNRTRSQGTDVQSEGGIKSSQNYNGHKGYKPSQSSLSRDKVEAESGFDNTAFDDNGTLAKDRAGSQDRLSGRHKGKHTLDWDDRYSNSDVQDSMDEYGDRKRRRRRHSRKSSRNSDDDSDYERERDYRRRRSYGRYSDDSDREYEQKERRKSRERYNHDKYDEHDDSDRDRYRDQSYDQDLDRPQCRRDSHERDRNCYREENRDYRNRRRSYDDGDDDDGRPTQQRRSSGRRHSPDEEQDSDASSRNGKRRSGGQENVRSKERSWESSSASIPPPPPPPYSEEDAQQKDYLKLPQPEEYRKFKEQTNKKPASSRDDAPHGQQQNLKLSLDETETRSNAEDGKNRHSRSQKPLRKGYLGSSPPKYEDLASKSGYVGVVYREESV